MLLKKIFRFQEIDFWLQIVFVGVLLFALWWRFQIGLTRFFDNDEFTHLHWAAAVARGQRPYIDFFTFFTPGFYWLLAPIIKIAEFGVEVFTLTRVAALLIFLGILGSLGYLYGIMRGGKYVLLPMILLAVLPMPYDKFLEIRPDNLATLLGLLGLIFEIKALLGKKWQWWLWSGMFYSLALIVLVKVLPFVVVGVGVAVVYFFKSLRLSKLPKRLMWFVVGLGLPLLVVSFWLLTLGDWSQVWYSLTRAGVEANQVGRRWVMEPHLFFFPNPYFYGGAGYTKSFLFNHLIWVLGGIIGTVSLFTPWLRGGGNRDRGWAEVLVGGVFFLTVAGYVVYFPLKHAQYLVPIAVFMTFYAAEAVVWMLGRLPAFVKTSAGEVGWGRLGGAVVFGWLLIGVVQETNTVKLGWNSGQQKKEFVALQKLIPRETPVVDLDGRLWFARDAYPICCLSFGEFTQFLTRPPVPLAQALAVKKPHYIFQGETNRFSHLHPQDQVYIRENYQPVPDWGEKLWERKKIK